MEKIKGTFTVGRTQAILAGKTEYGEVVVEIDPGTLTVEQREELSRCPYRKDTGFWLDSFVDSTSYKGDPELPQFGEVHPDAVTTFLNARIKIRESRSSLKEAEKKAARDEQLDPNNWIIYESGYIGRLAECFPDLAEKYPDIDHPNVYAPEGMTRAKVIKNPVWISDYKISDTEAGPIIETAKKILEQHNAKLMAAIRPIVEAKLKEAEEFRLERLEKEARRAVQISNWVTEFGAESQKKRHSVNLLPEKEVIDGIREQAFAPLDDFPRYQKIKGDDFCECDYLADRSLSFDVVDCSEATEEEFDLIEKIQAAVPSATVALRLHTGECSGCDQKMERKGLLVRMTVGQFDLSREYAV